MNSNIGYSNRLTEVERPAEFAGDTLEAQSENSFDQSSNILDFGEYIIYI